MAAPVTARHYSTIKSRRRFRRGRAGGTVLSASTTRQFLFFIAVDEHAAFTSKERHLCQSPNLAGLDTKIKHHHRFRRLATAADIGLMMTSYRLTTMRYATKNYEATMLAEIALLA